ncbi:hypothetical protein PCASD_00168 [Puccinia coronata f. sp. avenae]|uniref:Uncharacterized protein n=1 Tax=Puccinia coronata f. sp. avenae TaxID=200324 RepID=A0A2N5TFV1_9BASI|nr:hypothetical protein PCASD_09282 [Puccinia coronata f. sp. avenae]PLW52207.1 hypothetical protein PCASD_00168 [Puccinia coronata f. sp. avenae]
MVYVKYDRDLKVIAVKMSRRGMSLAEINAAIEKDILAHSLSQWNCLYKQTPDVVCNPAVYLPRGQPLAFTSKQQEFVLMVLEAEPTLYINKIQSHIQAMTSVQHPLWTILGRLHGQFTQCNVNYTGHNECAVSQATHSHD